VRRFLVTSLLAAVAFLITAYILPGMEVDGFSSAFIAVILIAAFNAVVRSFVLVLVAHFSLFLTGVLVLIFQVIVFLLVSELLPGVEVAGFATAFVGSLLYAIIDTLLTSLFNVDQSDTYYGLLVRALLSKTAAVHDASQPGLVIVQIDGLAYPILAGRIRAGSVNIMANLVRDRSHQLSPWEAILPSMTSASQAGICTAPTTASPPSAGTSATAST
jgi:uncharacterized membrane protein YvlD (DUF360 family)